MRDRICRSSGLGFLPATVVASIACAATVAAAPQVPDVIVFDVGTDGANTNDIRYWGTNNPGTIAAYNFATQSCNAGTGALDWFTNAGDTRHPVIAQNMFRLKDGRFEHIGYSWLKHGFCALSEVESGCSPCAQTDCTTLGVGCADTYWAMLNDGSQGRSKRFVNAAEGTHVEGGGQPTGGSIVRGRLQVRVEDIDPAQNPGAEWFIEGQYVTADDTLAGNGGNNASWRRIEVNAVSSVAGGGPTHREEPAIFAWKNQDPGVEIQRITNTEGAFTTYYFLGHRVTRTSPNAWQYEYALQNLTSTQCAGAFSVPHHPTATVSNIDFHGTRYHSGDPFDQTPWPASESGTSIDWATESFATNAEANALRWGTLYNYRFEANTPPEDGQITIGLFEPGINSSMLVGGVAVPSEFIEKNDIDQTGGPPATGPTVAAPLVFARNGSNHNPMGLEQQAPAALGSTWLGRLTEASTGVLVVGQGGPAEGLVTEMGEVLIRPPYWTLPQVGGRFGFHIPRDPDLIGTTVCVQAAALGARGWKLTNALDITVGM